MTKSIAMGTRLHINLYIYTTTRVPMLVLLSRNAQSDEKLILKPGVHTNDFAPIYGRRAKNLGHASLTTVFRPSRLKPGVHTNDFAPIHRLRALKLGHASLATVFRPGRLTLQPILRENLESPVLRYQPITTAVVADACLNTRWHHGAYTSAVLRESLGLDRVVTVYAELSRPDWLATVQSGRKQVQSRVCTPSFTFQPILRENLESPLLRYQPITTAVVTGVYLNTRWHHDAYTSAVLRDPLGLDRVVTVYVVQSAQ